MQDHGYRFYHRRVQYHQYLYSGDWKLRHVMTNGEWDPLRLLFACCCVAAVDSLTLVVPTAGLPLVAATCWGVSQVSGLQCSNSNSDLWYTSTSLSIASLITRQCACRACTGGRSTVVPRCTVLEYLTVTNIVRHVTVTLHY